MTRRGTTRMDNDEDGGGPQAPSFDNDDLDPNRWHSFVCSVRNVTRMAEYWVVRIGPSVGAAATAASTGGHKRRVLLYNPTNGCRYDIYRDHAMLPLTSIDSIFDASNIWANIQQQEQPWLNEFDLRNTTNWMPLFNRFRRQSRYESHTTCVQSPISYTYVNERYFESRAAEIERIIEQRFEKWRSAPTTWDYGVAGVLRENLRGMEEAAVAAQMHGQKHVIQETKGLSRMKQIYPGILGFPLRFKDCPHRKYTEDSEENPIVKKIRETRLHDRGGSNRFALAVYIHAYPNQIGSCWVYIATLPIGR